MKFTMFPKVKIMIMTTSTITATNETKEFKIGRLPVIIVKYDNDGRIIYRKDTEGYKEWYSYNEQGKLAYMRAAGFEEWYTYNEEGKLIGIIDSEDGECYFKPRNHVYPKISVDAYTILDIYDKNSGWEIQSSNEDRVILYKITNLDQYDCEPYEEWIEVYPDAGVMRYHDREDTDRYYDGIGSLFVNYSTN